MKTNLVRAALACAVLAIASTTAFATVTPIIATPVILEHDPAGIVARGVTDKDGTVVFRDLAPGKYVIEIDGKSLIKAMDIQGPINANGPIGSKVRSEITFEGPTNGEPPPPGFSVETCACHTGPPIRIVFTVPEPEAFYRVSAPRTVKETLKYIGP